MCVCVCVCLCVCACVGGVEGGEGVGGDLAMEGRLDRECHGAFQV